MLRNTIGKQIIPLCLLIILIASGCAGEAKPTAAPATAPTTKPGGPLVPKSILLNFLSNMPDAYGFALSQNVAKTKPFVVDVRQPDEYSKGFIEGAVNIPLRELVRNLSALPAMVLVPHRRRRPGP